MARLRYNNLQSTLGGSLTNSATSITFAAALTYGNGTSVPTIASPDYLPLTLIDSSNGNFEIVYLTAYTSAATTGTITRAQEGTTGIAHSSGDKVLHGPTATDWGNATPTIFASASAFSASSSPTITVPAGVTAGMMMIVMAAGAFTFNSASGASPLEGLWPMLKQVNGTNVSGAIFAATATGSSAGATITLSLGGSFGEEIHLVVLQGVSQLRGFDVAGSFSTSLTAFGTGPIPNATSPNTLVLGLAAARVASVLVTSNLPNTLVTRTSDSNFSSGVFYGSPTTFFGHQAGSPSSGSLVSAAVAVSG